MFHFLGFIFVILIAIFFIGLSIIGTIIRSIFGLGRRRPMSGSGTSYESNRQTNGSYSYGSQRASSDNHTVNVEEGELHPKRKKIFSKDEGEYVDFEEIKE